MFPHWFSRLIGIAICFANTDALTIIIDDAHDVIFLKIAFHAYDANGKNTYRMIGV